MTDNPFDAMLEPGDTGEANPFDAMLQGPQGQSSALGAFGRSAALGAAPAAGGLAGAAAGAEAGGELGAFAGPWGALAGGVIGGAIGGFGASWGVGKAQDYAISKMPDGWKDPLEQQLKNDQAAHPTASFLGGIAPYVATMSPFGAAKGATAALADNATTLQRLAANPITGRLFGGAVMGGVELGQEASQGDVDWRNVAISTGVGVIFNHPNRLGRAIEGFAASPFRARADEPGAEPAPITIAQANDLNVIGPGIDEQVFNGTHERDPEAKASAQEDARQEDVLMGRADTQPDVHAIARRMEPELFTKADELDSTAAALKAHIDALANPPDEHIADAQSKQADLEKQLSDLIESRNGYSSGPDARRLRAQIRDAQGVVEEMQGRRTAFEAGEGVETPEMAALRQQLLTVRQERMELGRDVAAAYRRAAEAASSETVEGSRPINEVEAAKAEDTGRRGATLFPDEAGAARAGRTEPVAALTDEKTEPDEATAPGEPAQPKIVPVAEAAPARSVAEQHNFIRDDVTRRLMAAGRPREEAEASAAIVAARYITRAARMKGALGSAEDLYRAEFPGIKGQGGPTSVPAASPRGARGGPRETMPQNLLAFLKASGGVRDDSGELSHMGMIKQYPGLVNNKRGRPLDEARRLAAEAGYLGGDASKAVGETTVDDLLTAMKRHPVYTPEGEQWVADYKARKFAEVEGDRLTDEREDFRKWAKENGHGTIDDELLDHAIMLRREDNMSEDEALEKAAIELYNRDEEARNKRNVAGSRNDLEDGQAGVENGNGPGSSGGSGGAQAPLRDDQENALDKELEDVDFFQSAKGKIRFVEGRRPIITLMRDADASTFMHELGHQWLEEMVRDAEHEAAPDNVKADAEIVRNWIGAKPGEPIKTASHEKFARGFEQYLREGVAPSKGLAGVFAKFKNWLTTIYQTLKGLGAPINDDIRGVFDRMLTEEPERTVIAPEQPASSSLADIHEADAAHVDPQEAEPAARRVDAERKQAEQETPPEIAEAANAAQAEKAEAPAPEPEPTGTPVEQMSREDLEAELASFGMDAPSFAKEEMKFSRFEAALKIAADCLSGAGGGSQSVNFVRNPETGLVEGAAFSNGMTKMNFVRDPSTGRITGASLGAGKANLNFVRDPATGRITGAEIK